ncbi:MAG: MATE family efflux transporter [Clostridia bacterium]|nr:MATE family efflux transporter [Clostridia bacterium]MBQ9920047.1 MATE family efflux transporter [Clostridia bacterium]
MATKTLTKNFTSGSIPKQLFWFALPFMASNALQVLYSTIDMIIVGRCVGQAGVAAVSQSSLIINFAVMVCLGVANAGQVLVSQALGSGKKKQINNIIGTLFTLLISFSFLLTILIIGLSVPILKVMNTPKESYDMAMQYLIICAAGLIFTAGYNMVSAVLRGMGDSKSPLLFIAIASVINLILDVLFTGFLGFGVAGAAWATIIGQTASFLFSVYYLYRRKDEVGFDFRLASLKPSKKYLKLIVSLGTPMAIQSGFINISMLFVTSLINSIGVNAGATFGVGVRIDDIINKLCMGIQYAAIPMISQNIGAGAQKRAQRVVYWTWLYSGVFTVICIVLYKFFGQELFMLFANEAEGYDTALAKDFISAILWMFPAFAIMRGSGAFVQGIGNAKLSMVLAILDGVVLRIGLSWLFGIALNLGFYGFVLGYGLAPYGFALPSMIYFLSGKWKKRKVLSDDM